MKLAIMQPYILPYIGYYQLINAVDKFVIYDNIQYTKKGWINRNRILINGKDEYFTLPLKKDSDYLDINQRSLVNSFPEEKAKLLRKFSSAYRKAPEFKIVFPLIESVFGNNNLNLFEFIYDSLRQVCEFLEIQTEFVISSTIPIDHSLKADEKVIAICRELKATDYLNPIGGLELYSKHIFGQSGVNLSFIKSDELNYTQFGNDFIPWLSIIDVLMFNNRGKTKQLLSKIKTT